MEEDLTPCEINDLTGKLGLATDSVGDDVSEGKDDSVVDGNMAGAGADAAEEGAGRGGGGGQ